MGAWVVCAVTIGDAEPWLVAVVSAGLFVVLLSIVLGVVVVVVVVSIVVCTGFVVASVVRAAEVVLTIVGGAKEKTNIHFYKAKHRKHFFNISWWRVTNRAGYVYNFFFV